MPGHDSDKPTGFHRWMNSRVERENSTQRIGIQRHKSMQSHGMFREL